MRILFLINPDILFFLCNVLRIFFASFLILFDVLPARIEPQRRSRRCIKLLPSPEPVFSNSFNLFCNSGNTFIFNSQFLFYSIYY